MAAVTNPLEELTRAGELLTRELDFKLLVSRIVEQSIDITKSDMACLYVSSEIEQKKSDLVLVYKRGRFPAPARFSADSELIDFIRECDESVVLLERKKSPFTDIFLDPAMQSGMALPLSTPGSMTGILVLNSLNSLHYKNEWFHFLDSYTRLGGGMLRNSRMVQQIREYLNEIKELELYQQNIFTSMTNMLVTLDNSGTIKYFNSCAGEKLSLTDADIGMDFDRVFSRTIDKKILKAVRSALSETKEQLEIEGIFRDEKEIDFSLIVSPLKGPYGKSLGLTLLFTDQTMEKALEKTVNHVVEERRVIKDMFSRYLSAEVVQKLTDEPGMVKPGGDKKDATIFFADIRGYTSFSEGKEPEYIIEVLNEYFGEAVEIIVRHKGYIDKFIGDAIMAAWGVPLQTAKEDAIDAVSCALEIQNLVGSGKRSFFKGAASVLKVGIGIHTGPLVAGNLGSPRRMDYTVIGDTVNIAARLESVAGPGEVIITEKTRSMLDDIFLMEHRQPVKVKGKSEPIQIYKVLKKR